MQPVVRHVTDWRSLSVYQRRHSSRCTKDSESAPFLFNIHESETRQLLALEPNIPPFSLFLLSPPRPSAHLTEPCFNPVYCCRWMLARLFPSRHRLVFDKGSVSPVALDGVEEFSHMCVSSSAMPLPGCRELFASYVYYSIPVLLFFCASRAPATVGSRLATWDPLEVECTC